MYWLNMRYILMLVTLMVVSCITTEKIADGRSAYERKRFAQAIQYLLPEYEAARNPLVRGELAYMLGDSYDHIGFYPDAQKWFFEAYDAGYGLEALLKYADLSSKIGQYGEAGAAYQMLADETNNLERFQKFILASNQAQQWQAQSDQDKYLMVENMQALNSAKSDVLNQVYGKDYLLISSDRDESEGRNYYAWTGHKFYDIFEYLNREISLFDDFLVNTEHHEGDGSFDAGRERFVFTRCEAQGDEYDVYCKIMYSFKSEEGVWSDPEQMPFTAAQVNFMHPTITPDGTRVYFSSDIDKNARGYDLFYTDWSGSEWSEPEILNMSDINTEFNELYPTLHHDTLYFSSDRPGMGGLDIYKTYEVNGRFVYAQNLLPPINSSYDDFKYLPFDPVQDDRINTAYFSSNRPGGAGGDDVYMFYRELPEPLAPDVDQPQDVYTYALNIRTVTRKEDPQTGEMLRFPLEESQVRIQGAHDTTMVTDMNGEAMIRGYRRAPMNIAFTKSGYFTYKENLGPDKLSSPDTIGNEIVYQYSRLMDPIVRDKEIVLENIYYDYDRWNIRPDARPVLDSLATLLLDNPEISLIELTSHTDCRGSDEYNEDLSQKRAESAVEYLIQAGIEVGRLTARGYGESMPVVDCVCESCSEEEHQANRRTAFRIMEAN